MESILITIKKMLGVDDEYEHFDQDIIVNINTVFMILNQLGVGPKQGFVIRNKDTTWNDYVDDINIEAVRTYIYLRVRLLFDPPANSFLVEAIKSQISEIEWRLNVQAEGGN